MVASAGAIAMIKHSDSVVKNGFPPQFKNVSNHEIKVVQSNDHTNLRQDELEGTPFHAAVLSCLSYLIGIFFGFLRHFMQKCGLETSKVSKETGNEGFVPLYSVLESFYRQYLYMRTRDCFNRPISSAAGPEIDIIDRKSDDYNQTLRHLGTTTRALNLSSYNYLGFAENSGPCVDAAEDAVRKYGIGGCSSRFEYGTLEIHRELESLVARFVSKPAAMVFGMGFATNSGNIPALVGRGDLIISDKLNHTSLILGARLSGAKIKIFKHNDMKDLENVLRDSVIQGQPRSHRAWRKILIIVEGVYSMEGSLVKLPQVVALKKKYKAYVYLDEAHSIGAIGPNGRGVTDYWGVDTSDIDIMMGTFTKSFAAVGGYIAASEEIINHIRGSSYSAAYATCMSPPAVLQIITSMKIVMGEDGTDEGKRRIITLAENCKYFRRRLREMNLIVYGHEASAVVPIVTYLPGRSVAFSREMLKRKVAVVFVGFPATSPIKTRIRICISASHTREMLDKALQDIDELGDSLRVKYSRRQWKKQKQR